MTETQKFLLIETNNPRSGLASIAKISDPSSPGLDWRDLKVIAFLISIPMLWASALSSVSLCFLGYKNIDNNTYSWWIKR